MSVSVCINCLYQDKISSYNKSDVLKVKICVSFSFQYIIMSFLRGDMVDSHPSESIVDRGGASLVSSPPLSTMFPRVTTYKVTQQTMLHVYLYIVTLYHLYCTYTCEIRVHVRTKRKERLASFVHVYLQLFKCVFVCVQGFCG